jgi:hypothetical protein
MGWTEWTDTSSLYIRGRSPSNFRVEEEQWRQNFLAQGNLESSGLSPSVWQMPSIEEALTKSESYLREAVSKANGVELALASKPGAPVLPCRTFKALPIWEKVSYRILLVPNARRFRAGHKLRLYLTTDDQSPEIPALLEFRHASIGTSSFNTVFSSSRLLLPTVS